jgi:DNA-binding transcriptional regulator YdaS (Cro superfamily)
MSVEALQRAIDVAGGQSALAASVNEFSSIRKINQSHVWNWLNRGKKGVPPEFVIPIEKVTGVHRHELRPDIYPQDGAQ